MRFILIASLLLQPWTSLDLHEFKLRAKFKFFIMTKNKFEADVNTYAKAHNLFVTICCDCKKVLKVSMSETQGSLSHGYCSFCLEKAYREIGLNQDRFDNIKKHKAEELLRDRYFEQYG